MIERNDLDKVATAYLVARWLFAACQEAEFALWGQGSGGVRDAEQAFKRLTDIFRSGGAWMDEDVLEQYFRE